MKKLLFATLVGSTAMMSGAAMAQQATEPGAAGQPPVEGQTLEQPADATATTSPAVGGQLDLQDGFVVVQGQDQVLGSALMSAEVIGLENESIGTVDDILLDNDGRIVAIVVGVGGFLGIGQKDVAIPTDSLEFVLAQDAAAAAPADGAMAPADPAAVPADPAAAPGTGAAAPAAGTAPAAGDPAAGTTATGTATGTWGWTGGTLEHIQVDFTRDQLEAAPEFETID